MKPPFPFLTAAALAAAVILASASRAAEHVVEIIGFAYFPDSIAARPGDTVTWINRDIVPHTATAVDQSWDTGGIEPKGRRTLELPAGFAGEYSCIYHPAMRGTLQERTNR